MSSNRNDDGVFSKVTKAAKSVLPTSWFQSEEEKKAAIERKRIEKEVTGGLTEILKDAPLPIRMLGGVMAPIMSNLMSSMTEIAEQQRQGVETTLRDARSYLMADPAVERLLGGSIEVGNPFSQSSSSYSINGQTQSRIEISFPVSGTMASGVARAVVIDGDKMQQLDLQVGGRVMAVSLAQKASSSAGRVQGVRGATSDIIEAEIIEKNTK